MPNPLTIEQMVRNQPPSPPINRTYSGPPAAELTTYDKNWQLYDNLENWPGVADWMMAQPEWQNFVAWVALDPPNATIHANAPDMTTIIAALTAASVAIAINPTPMPPTASPPAHGVAEPLSPSKPL